MRVINVYSNKEKHILIKLSKKSYKKSSKICLGEKIKQFFFKLIYSQAFEEHHPGHFFPHHITRALNCD